MSLFGKKNNTSTDELAGISFNADSDVQDVLPAKGSFAERVKAFWEWFSEHEGRIADTIHGEIEDADTFISFLSEGVGLISEDIHFNIGGDNEFTFAVSGDDYLHYLLPYIVEQMPEPLQGKWHFFTGMQGTGGQDFGLRMNGVDAGAGEVYVSVAVADEEKKADLAFFSEKLAGLEDKDAYGFFYILMENIIGEALAYTCIGSVDRASEKDAGMIPLTELEAKLRRDVWTEEGSPDPAQNYFVYELDIAGDYPRSDVFIGRGCYGGIINGYLNGDDGVFDAFAGCGARASYLFFETDPEQENLLEIRNAIEDALIETVLNDESKDRAGLLFGAAMGRKFAYLDFLIFDPEAFLAQLNKVLCDHPGVTFYLAEFKKDGLIATIRPYLM